MLASIPVPLVSFCEKLATAVTTAGNQNGWRVQLFGRRGFNADVTVAKSALKITTSGQPGPDGAGATVKFSNGRLFSVRAVEGELELRDDANQKVDLGRFVDLVAEACGVPIAKPVELPITLVRLCEKLAGSVVAGGNDAGWKVQTFGAKGFNADVILGGQILKIFTEGSPAPDGSGAVFKLKRPGFERLISTKVAKDGELELVDETAQPVSLDRFLDLVAEGCFTSIKPPDEFPNALNRFYERVAGAIMRTGQDNVWAVRRFGTRGFNCDCALGVELVKVTTDAKFQPDGSGITMWIKKPGLERTFSTRLRRDGDLEMLDEKGSKVDLDKFVDLIADALGSPIDHTGDEPAPLVRLCERIASAVVSAGNDNGWAVKMFGSRGINCDVAVGPVLAKLTSHGKPAADGSGMQIKVARTGAYEKVVTTKKNADELELVDERGQVVSLSRLVEMTAEACGAPLKEVAELPPPLRVFLERVSSTVATAGENNAWKVTRFGSRGYNADLTIGPNTIKVTTEGKPAADGSGAVVRIKRAGYDKPLTVRARDTELELIDEGGHAVPMPKLVDLLKDACRV